jgi:hypothetical protein
MAQPDQPIKLGNAVSSRLSLVIIPCPLTYAYRVSGSWTISGFDAYDESFEALHRHTLRLGN